MKRLLLPILLSLVGSFAGAATLSKDPFGCTSENMLNEVREAVRKNDNQRFNWALNNGCTWLKPNINFSVLERGISTSKIRVYVDKKNSLVMYIFAKDLTD